MRKEDFTLAQSVMVTWFTANGLCMVRRRVTVDAGGGAKLLRPWGVGGRGKHSGVRDMTALKTYSQ